MPDFNFNFELSTIVTGAVQVLIIVAVTWILLWLVKKAVRKLINARIPQIREESEEQLSSRAETLASVVNRVISFITWFIAFMMILTVFGINVAPIIAAIGLAGLAVGFAAQNIIRDYFHGFFIIMEDWFRVGEVATCSGQTGVIESMGLRLTVLRDLNGTMHVIPNSKIDQTSNMAREWARINLDISVGYNENLDKVFQVVNDVCMKFKEDSEWSEHMLTTPEVVRVNNLGDSGIEIKVMGDTKPMQQWALMGELRKRIKERFDEEGIEIPWPHTKVYFGNTLERKEVK
ncbi:MAG: mechanosensitive ion channel family protein [Dehalococcoidia bacterium]